MTYSTDVAAARDLAIGIHAGQTDKAGQPYIGHLDRVAKRLSDPRAQVVAYLHDSIEDTGIDAAFLTEKFGDGTAYSVLKMTHSPRTPYMDYVRAIKDDPIARQVKISDLIDNSNLSRLPLVTIRDAERQRKYNDALQLLLSQQ